MRESRPETSICQCIPVGKFLTNHFFPKAALVIDANLLTEPQHMHQPVFIFNLCVSLFLPFSYVQFQRECCSCENEVGSYPVSRDLEEFVCFSAVT